MKKKYQIYHVNRSGMSIALRPYMGIYDSLDEAEKELESRIQEYQEFTILPIYTKE